MKINSIQCKADIDSKLMHVKYFITDSKAIVAIFWNFLENAEGYSYALSDQEASQVLSSNELNKLTFTQVFTSKQLNFSGENSYWRVSDIKTLDLNDPYYSSAEIEAPVMWSMIVNHSGKISGPYNKFIETFNRKSTTVRDANINSSVVLLTAFSASSNPKSFSQCRLALSYNKNSYFDANVLAEDVTNKSFDERTADLLSYFPLIKLTGNTTINADQTTTLNISFIDPETNLELTNYSANVYLQTTGGYINKQRVFVSSNGASIIVRALDLEPGDKFKVKAGYRNYTGVSEINYKVV